MSDSEKNFMLANRLIKIAIVILLITVAILVYGVFVQSPRVETSGDRSEEKTLEIQPPSAVLEEEVVERIEIVIEIEAGDDPTQAEIIDRGMKMIEDLRAEGKLPNDAYIFDFIASRVPEIGV